MVLGKSIPSISFEVWTYKKPSLRHLYIWDYFVKIRVFNLHERKLGPRTSFKYFISYLKEYKGYRFYYYSKRIVEYDNTIFIENDKTNRSEKPQKLFLI